MERRPQRELHLGRSLRRHVQGQVQGGWTVNGQAPYGETARATPVSALRTPVLPIRARTRPRAPGARVTTGSGASTHSPAGTGPPGTVTVSTSSNSPAGVAARIRTRCSPGAAPPAGATLSGIRSCPPGSRSATRRVQEVCQPSGARTSSATGPPAPAWEASVTVAADGAPSQVAVYGASPSGAVPVLCSQ